MKGKGQPHRIAVVPGDGIGVEVTRETLKVLDALRQARGLRLEIDEFDETVRVPGRGRIPVNVAIACRWTWFCSERYPTDPHANRVGYRRIGGTFEREVLSLLVM